MELKYDRYIYIFCFVDRWICLVYSALTLRLFCLYGGNTVWFLYTRLKFEYDSEEFTDLYTTDSLIGVAGVGFLSIVGMKLLNLRDTTLGVLGALSYTAGAIIYGVAYAGWMAYLGNRQKSLLQGHLY